MAALRRRRQRRGGTIGRAAAVMSGETAEATEGSGCRARPRDCARRTAATGRAGAGTPRTTSLDVPEGEARNDLERIICIRRAPTDSQPR